MTPVSFFQSANNLPGLLPYIILPFLGYAEIHFRLPFFRGRLFMKEPEIVFDLPYRAEPGVAVPLFLFIKDAHLYPVHIEKIQVTVSKEGDEGFETSEEVLDIEVGQKFFAHTLKLSHRTLKEPGKYRVVAELIYTNNKRNRRRIIQDNYKTIPHEPFELLIAQNGLPSLPGWRWGDLHVHSNFTDDQVEYGAPVKETAQAAKTIGLDFVGITDHSYDLDDEPDNYLKNDPDLKKWDQLREIAADLNRSDSGFVVIPAEEVSAGNHSGYNVHCLVLNDPLFHPGYGDGGENLLRNRPTHSLEELYQRKRPQTPVIAAHPLEKPPFSQKLVFRRGWWETADRQHQDLTALQILNGKINRPFREGLEAWKNLLLAGRRIGLAGGSDAHGNFNCYRQIRLPLINFDYSRNHLLGEMRTAVYCPDFSLFTLQEAILHNRSVISTGPLLALQIKRQEEAIIGGDFIPSKDLKLMVTAESTSEFGVFSKLVLYSGSTGDSQENKEEIMIPENSHRISMSIDLDGTAVDYIRMEAYTQMANHEYFCITNPIWKQKGC